MFNRLVHRGLRNKVRMASRISLTKTFVYQTRSWSSKKRLDRPAIFDSPLLWYSHKLDTNPVVTKCISAGLVSGSGNIWSQWLMHKEGPFQVDWAQTGRFSVLNVLFVAPCLHFWYTWLDSAIPGKAMKQVLKRVFYDEFVFTPVYVPVLMALLWTMEGVEAKRLPKMIGAEWLNIMLFDWAVYVPVQIVNFRYVPVKFQVLAINIVGVGWNCFFCWRAKGQHNKLLMDHGVPYEPTENESDN